MITRKAPTKPAPAAPARTKNAPRTRAPVSAAPRRPSKRAAQQHDLYCRAALSDLAVANELLRLLLGDEIVALITDGPPTLEHGNHVDEDSRASRPDFRFAYWRKGGGRVKIVLEHKSWCDPGTPAQLCRYAPPALDAKDHEPGDQLFLAVLYHGEGEWTVPHAAEPGAPPPPSGLFLYLLLSLMRLDPEALARRLSPKTWVAATAMTGAFAEEVRTKHLDGLLLALPDSGAFSRQTLKYVSGAWGLEKDALDAKLAVLKSDEGGAIMGNTLWDIEERAEKRAYKRAKVESLLVLLRLKFDGVPDEAARKVQTASLKQLDTWTAAVLTAANLDELLAAQP